MSTTKVINPFDHERFIGYVSYVSPELIKIHFPNSSLLSKLHHAGENLHGGMVGSFVVIEEDHGGFLGKISKVYVSEKNKPQLSEESFKKSDFFQPVGEVEILVWFNDFETEIKKGINAFPVVGAKVYTCSPRFLKERLGGFGRGKEFSIAALAQDNDISLSLGSQSIFGRHCAIVGSTGAGKSYTISKLLEQFLINRGKTILIDATGEFSCLDIDSAVEVATFNDNVNSNYTFFHYKNLSEGDLMALFKPAQQMQAPKLQEAIKSLKVLKILEDRKFCEISHKEFLTQCYKHSSIGIKYVEKSRKSRTIFLKAEKVLEGNYMQNNNFDINSLPYQIFQECVWDNDKSNPDCYGEVSDTARSHCQSLISRINSALRDENWISILGFSEQSPDTDNELTNKIEKFLKDDTKNILRICFKNVPYTANMREILLNAIARFFLEKARKGVFLNDEGVVVFIDEAHQFLNKKITNEFAIEFELDAVEQIAKECRKYGLFLAICTQMPRDIPGGVLSQMGTFIVHRTIHQKDKETIAHACPDGTASSLSFLPSLPSGEALVIGIDFPMPLVIKIQSSKYEPFSNTPKLKFIEA